MTPYTAIQVALAHTMSLIKLISMHIYLCCLQGEYKGFVWEWGLKSDDLVFNKNSFLHLFLCIS